MKTSDKGMELIKSFEGCCLTSYKCPAGIWTIGYGHTAGVAEGQVITQEQAEVLLEQAVEEGADVIFTTSASWESECRIALSKDAEGVLTDTC